VDNSGVKTGNLWDIFCKVIDNFGDIGVCWRLAADLAARGERVRLWVDDASALGWMAPTGAPNIEVKTWTQPIDTHPLAAGDHLLEAFGCDIPSEFITAFARWAKAKGGQGVWLNLEYLSAEGFVERSHSLPSPVMSGPGSGLTKHFFYPGFTKATGGLLREADLSARQAGFQRGAWLSQQGIELADERLVSLFCYEPPALGQLLDQLASDVLPTRLLVTSGRASAAVKACIKAQYKTNPLWNSAKKLAFTYLPALTQYDFDHLLWTCDLNFVRGEDSLIRALWANKPFIWQIYRQHDDVHHSKLTAFLDQLNAPLSLRAFHQAWNTDQSETAPVLPALALVPWQQTASLARSRQLCHDDLVTQLLFFAAKKH
jgi:uncharacterized repeat protein (TIGR03837 family)